MFTLVLPNCWTPKIWVYAFGIALLCSRPIEAEILRSKYIGKGTAEKGEKA